MRFPSLMLIASIVAAAGCTGSENPDVVDATADTSDVSMDRSNDIDNDVPTDVGDAGDALDAMDAMDDQVVDAGPFEQVQQIFDHSCAVATNQCHNEGNVNNLRLDRGFSYDQIVGVASDEVPRLARVTANDSAHSYLALKLEHSTLDAVPECAGDAFPPPCGNVMPAPPMSPLRASEIAVIRQWIDMGAPR